METEEEKKAKIEEVEKRLVVENQMEETHKEREQVWKNRVNLEKKDKSTSGDDNESDESNEDEGALNNFAKTMKMIAQKREQNKKLKPTEKLIWTSSK